MKAHELRIWNLVSYSGGTRHITQVSENLVWLQTKGCEKASVLAAIEEIEPIPLTEEWLIKFGFKISKYGFPTKNNFQVGHVTTDENYQFEYSLGTIGKWILKDIKYVHQLQNLYFALTGKELELNENL